MRNILCIILLFILPTVFYGQNTMLFKNINSNGLYNVNNFVVVDKSLPQSPPKIVAANNIIRLDKYNSSYDITFTIQNNSSFNNIVLFSNYVITKQIILYKKENNNFIRVQENTDEKFSTTSVIINPDIVYPLSFSGTKANSYLLHVETISPISLNLKFGTVDTYVQELNLKNLLVGIYVGILLGTFFYNLFIYFSLRDKSYLFYCLYIIFLAAAQICSLGYFNVFFPGLANLSRFILPTVTSLAFIAGLMFAKNFLYLKDYLPKTILLINAVIISYLLVIVCDFFELPQVYYNLLNFNAIVGSFSVLIFSAIVVRKGHKPAIFYLIAWSILLAGLIIYVLKNLGIIQQNFLTNYIILIGSALESVLLSIALANRINVLQKEKNISQANALAISQENEKLIKQQNIVLEEKVTERTNELQITNNYLNNTLTELKDAQMQLVEAEKMASLGQLTAGIAHEINNPINFVKSNIIPLKLDVKDIFSVIDQYDDLHEDDKDTVTTKLRSISSYKKEIDIDLVKKEIENLIKGIEEGAERTAEIVRGLRTFSRVDESELKTANLHEGIDSTLVLLRNSMPPYIKIERNYEANGEVECYPGKINQVFMNILNNAVQAICSKQVINEEEFIYITTKDIKDNQIMITIKDTGPGMSDEVKQKIYEPFFTTKPVGEGTGLGMAIVFKIIEKHLGKINIVSSVGNGAEFTLILPYLHPLS